MLHITHGERRALQMLADGAARLAIAEQLNTTESDVEARLRALFDRMGTKCETEALTDAVRRGLLAPGTRPADRHDCERRRSTRA